MRNRTLVGGIVAAGVLVGIFWLARKGKAGDKPMAAPGVARESIELTVYASDFGMVKEVRPMQLAAGGNRLSLLEVSKQLDPQSVLLGWQGESANAPQLVAHAYDLGVGNGDGLLKRYLGKEVELVRYGQDGHEAERQKGTLMVGANDNIVLQSDGKFYINPKGTIVAATTPEIVPIPQLSVQANSAAAQAANLDVAYLTRGLSWSADYVATLSPDSDTLSLEGWATVTNRTGADYPNAKVTLIAGTPNRAVQTARDRYGKDSMYVEGSSLRSGMGKMEGRPLMPAPKAIAAPENVGEFHAYPIKNATTVVQEQMNRLLMLSASKVAIVRDYNTRPPQLAAWDDYGYGWGSPNRPTRGSVAVAITFYNREKDGLGDPLPQGAIRLYEPDAHGTLRYAGAASIADTPKNQSLYLTLANAFDVFTESKVVSKKRLDKRTLRKTIHIALHNEKKTAVPLRVVQGFAGHWKIVEESHKHTNLDAADTQWKITLPANSTTTLRYTVDLTM